MKGLLLPGDPGFAPPREERCTLDEYLAEERERQRAMWSRLSRIAEQEGPTALHATGTYELGMLTTGVTNATPAAEIVAGTAKAMSILEMGMFLNAATATTLSLGRPGNTPSGGTAQTATNPLPLPPSGGASLGGIILSGWGTTPTVPAAGNTMRQISLAAAVGNGVIWNWDEGELMVSPTRSLGLVLWNAGASSGSALRYYIKWTE